MKKYVSVLILFFIAALNSASVIATPSPSASSDPQQHLFTQMDTNNDGYISHDEYLVWHTHWLEWKFLHIDSDDDGYLSGDEFHSIGRKGTSEKNRRDEIGHGVPLK